MAQRLADAFEPVEDVDGGKDVGGVRALFAAGSDEAVLLEAGQHRLEQALLRATSQQPVAAGSETVPALPIAGRIALPVAGDGTPGLIPSTSFLLVDDRAITDLTSTQWI